MLKRKRIYGSFCLTFILIFENSFLRCDNAMKLGLMNKLTIVNIFVLQTLYRIITRIAIFTHKTTIKSENLKAKGERK